MSLGSRKWPRFLFAGVFAVTFFALYEQSSAATISCSTAAGIVDTTDPRYTSGFDVTNYVTPTDGCQIGSSNNDVQNPLKVNADSVFGGGWVFAEKLQVPGGGTLLSDNSDESINIGLATSTGSTSSGTWSINDVWSIYDSIMLVFKSGNGSSIDPNNYVAYLLTEGATTGSYYSPFYNSNGAGSLAGISHISAYVMPTVVPLPAALPLFGAALFGVGLWSRKRRRNTDAATAGMSA